MAAKTPFRILCFGDSLTDGYPVAHPYAGKLIEGLEAAFPSYDVQVDIDGLPGDQVQGSFLRRMQRQWARSAEGYDWTIVLGGTNDIAWRSEADAIFSGLKQTWDIPLSKGRKVLALTVPECEGNNMRSNATRSQLNKAIKAHKHDRFYTFDLFEELPFHSMISTDRERNWDLDGLHLTEDGYDFMGEKIAEGLIKILHLEEAQTTEISSIFTDARQRRLIEDMIFDEEAGDPKRINQGYIIVRKRDLD